MSENGSAGPLQRIVRSAPVTVCMPRELTSQMIADLRNNPLTKTDSQDEWHRRLGWLLCAWEVLLANRVPPADGWKPVPREPTKAMLEAADGIAREYGCEYGMGAGFACSIWYAMLDEAPTAIAPPNAAFSGPGATDNQTSETP